MNTQTQNPAAEQVAANPPTAAPRAQPMVERDHRASRSLAQRHDTGSGAIDTSPPAVIARMLSSGIDLAQMKGMLELQERWEATEARKAFITAMANFKSDPPTIAKDKSVGYNTKEGDFVGYKHASIGNVVGKIVAGLAQHGLSHRWTVEQAEQITVTCTITHERGHSESVTMRAGKDDSGKKNPIQQVASTITYLQRYTLLAATGLATNDQPDDDGRGVRDEKGDTVSKEQLKELDTLLTALVPTSIDESKFEAARDHVEKTLIEALAATWRIEKLADLPAKAFDHTVDLLKRRKQKMDQKRGAK